MSKTLRLVIPEWHGGINPDYVFGSQLLSQIAPQSADDTTIHIDVNTDYQKKLNQVDGIDGGDFLLQQMTETRKALEAEQPDKVIVFGGDCSVTQVPLTT